MSISDSTDKLNKIVTLLRIIKKELKEDPPSITLKGIFESDIIETVSWAIDNHGWKKSYQVDSTIPEDSCTISINCNLSLNGEGLAFQITKDWKIDPRERLFVKEGYNISEPFKKKKKPKIKPKQIDISGEYKYDKIIRELNDNIKVVLSSAIT